MGFHFSFHCLACKIQTGAYHRNQVPCNKCFYTEYWMRKCIKVRSITFYFKGKRLLAYSKNTEIIFSFFQLFPLGLTTADHLPPSHLVPSILLYHTNPLHVLHYIQKSYLWFSFFLLSGSSILNTLIQPLSLLCSNHVSLASLTRSHRLNTFKGKTATQKQINTVQ